ncbi:hypothetical protein CHGG_07323 [Chaetomium globosum CBS 148.51]|uniref:Uncharacterized protein n=1 Tax=Chaetomium globosum (strain ATCC 6205 / CBS 148.51 / DSM 1962 / NBRC 6347 / NRRL 1970) TaxID=306901 RepID=Q2GXI1_CHAGB|nr:uncharacterized protein CHGG_07323 [Chaetomium globosum CBS 148.51]EAQ86070.1 hypothetical protein CHGG_07323 [Chaetomium globosum CBS 148.51]
MSGRAETIVAHVEDVDEFDNIIEGTGRYANSVAPSSPAKEQPNTGRARREKARRGSSSPITTSIVTDSDSTLHPRRDSLKKSSKDREKSVSKKALMAASRPPVKHSKTAQGIPRRDESAYYGVDPTVTPAISRPRAQSRPTSFYAVPRPPAANARFYANQTPGPSPPTSFPPPSWMGPGPGPGPGHGPPGHGHGPSPFGPPSSSPLVMHHPPPPPPTSDYFARPLESRFGSRPQSSMGFRPPRAIEYDDYEEPVEKALTRRPSMPRKVSKNDDDKRAMPPPRRPSSARPTAMPFRPPSTPARRRGDLDEHDPDMDNALFSDLSPLAPVGYDFSPIPFRPRPSFGAESGYDMPDQHTEVAGHRRRNSYYGGNSISSGSAYEDKMRQASRYQDDIIGVPQMPLTAETLRKAGKSGGTSSRSTRSSGSHDESDYRQSATTRTTRSTAPNNDEDVTIRVKGSTVLKFGNTEMQCQDGAEINITSRSGNPEIRAAGSDRSSYVDQDDRRTRVDQDDRRTRVDIPTQSRVRATSRAKSRPRSFSRSFSKYDVAAPKYEVGRYDAGPRYDGGPDYDAYTTYAPTLPPPPPPPPYPEYPSSYSSRPGEYFGGPPL